MFEVMARIGFIGAMQDTGCNLSNWEVEEVVRAKQLVWRKAVGFASGKGCQRG